MNAQSSYATEESEDTLATGSAEKRNEKVKDRTHVSSGPRFSLPLPPPLTGS